MYSILFLAATSFLLCLVLTPLVRDWFKRRRLLDNPDGRRKVHGAPIPRVGGIAIAFSYIGAVALLVMSTLHGAGRLDFTFIWALFPAAGVIFAVGLTDDLMGLRAGQKLAGQVVAAGFAFAGGVRIMGVAGYSVDGWLSFVLTAIWLVACTNAFNLIDGVDGLAAGVGLFATLTTFLAAILQNNVPLALATVPLAGALLAFLRYNFNPASVFLGDCGSLLTGFLLGCFGVIWSQKSATLLGLTAPLMALAIPLLDTILSVMRRFLRNQPIFGGDRNHIHHRLLDRGLSPRGVALLLYAGSGIAAVFSLLQSFPQNNYGGVVLLVFCITVWIGVQHLGYGEFRTARTLVMQGAFRHVLDTQLHMIRFERKLATAASAEEWWKTIRESCREYGFEHVKVVVAGQTWQDAASGAQDGTRCDVHIPLSPFEYVEFTHAHEFSVRNMVAMASMVDILQRARLPEGEQPVEQASARSATATK